MRILTESQERLLQDERQILSDLRVHLVEYNATPEDQQTLAESIQQLDDLFLLVVVGEFNAGKSAFINAFLGERLLEEGVTPTTTHINLLRYGPAQGREVINERQHILRLPVEWLSEISIVDTPGTNAIIRAHEAITSQFVPRSDLVLFVTSVDRPFTESERAFLERIRDWGKKVVFIINKIDILENEKDLNTIESFVKENARSLLGIAPETFPISARLALRAKTGEPELWDKSRFAELEDYVRSTLDEISRLRLKLQNPMGVGMFLVDRYLEIFKSRLEILREDFDMLADVESQMQLYEADMQRDFKFRMADIEKILYQMDQRGQDYFDETFRLAKIFDLLSKDRIRTEFEQRVTGDIPQKIEAKVTELIDWLVESDLRQWQAVNEHIADRRRTHQGRIIGEGIGSFSYDRSRVLDSVGKEAQNIVDTYDRVQEAQAIAQGAQEAVATSAFLEVGAIGLGAIISVLATTVAADVTGILLASFIAALGLFVIPARRKLAKNEMRSKINALRDKLSTTLNEQFEKEIQRSVKHIEEAISPYTRFVRAERSNLLQVQSKLEETRNQLGQLKVSIEEL